MRHGWTTALGIGLLLGASGSAPAQDADDPAAKVEAVRKQIEAAAAAARAAVAEEQRVREAATDTLAGLGEAAIPALVAVVKNADVDSAADQDFAARCREALDRLGYVTDETKARMAELVTALRDGAFEAGDNYSVLEIGGHAARELAKALDHADFKGKPRARARILELLGMLGHAGRVEVIGDLLKRLSARFPEDCGPAAAALVDSAFVPTGELTEVRDPKRLAARDAAVQAAGGVGPLLAVLKHHVAPAARAAAAEALGAFERTDAVAALMAAAAEPDAAVRTAAIEALAAVTGASPGADGAAWARWWQGAQGGFPAQVPTPEAVPGG